MLVRELILELEAILKDHPEMGMSEIITEGSGDIGRVTVEQEWDGPGHYVYLMRSDDKRMGF